MSKSNKRAKAATTTTAAKPSTPISAQTQKLPTLSRKNTLQVNELEPHQIYVIPDFLTNKECDAFIQFFDTHLAPQPVPAIPKPGEAFRSNDRQSMPSQKLANLLWDAGLDHVCRTNEGIASVSRPRVPMGLNSNIRVYRYRVGQKFECHYDDAVQDRVTGLWTDWTLLIYLSDDMDGGQTVFHKRLSKKRTETVSVAPQKGLALLHRHGTHCLLHEALAVTRGEKWVLRSDVLIGRSA